MTGLHFSEKDHRQFPSDRRFQPHPDPAASATQGLTQAPRTSLPSTGRKYLQISAAWFKQIQTMSKHFNDFSPAYEFLWVLRSSGFLLKVVRRAKESPKTLAFRLQLLGLLWLLSSEGHDQLMPSNKSLIETEPFWTAQLLWILQNSRDGQGVGVHIPGYAVWNLSCSSRFTTPELQTHPWWRSGRTGSAESPICQTLAVLGAQSWHVSGRSTLFLQQGISVSWSRPWPEMLYHWPNKWLLLAEFLPQNWNWHTNRL